MEKKNYQLKAKHIGTYSTMATERDRAGNPRLDENTGEPIQRRVKMYVYSVKGTPEAEQAYVASKLKDGLSEDQANKRHEDGGLIFHSVGRKGSKKSYIEINGYSGRARLVDPVAELYEDAIESQGNEALKNNVAAKVADRVVANVEAELEAKLAEIDAMFNDTDDDSESFVSPENVSLDDTEED